MNIVFLDFDGVIRVRGRGAWMMYAADTAFFDPDLIKRVADLAKLAEAKIVISSDWKDFGKKYVLNVIKPWITKDMLHDDWATIRMHATERTEEICDWLTKHPETEKFVILDDNQRIFSGPLLSKIESHIVWCNNSHGFVPQLYGEAVKKLIGPDAP